MRLTTMLRLARSGDPRGRVRVMRDGLAAVRLAAVAAGLRTGVLDLLAEQPSSVGDLARRAGWADDGVLAGLLRVLESLGLVAVRDGGWRLTRRGRALVGDDVVRAAHEAFDGFHTGLYQEVEDQLAGRGRRRDVAERGDVIARLSQAMDPFVLDVLTGEVARRTPGRVLDVGCATGSHLAHLLSAAPQATGVGIEVDPAAAAMARETMRRHGLAERAEILEGDARTLLPPGEQFDLALLANVVYYLPAPEREELLHAVASRVRHGGAVVVVTTALTPALFSRHFDLLLRSQEGSMGLPSVRQLVEQLRAAGLEPARPRRVGPGEPLMAVVATR